MAHGVNSSDVCSLLSILISGLLNVIDKNITKSVHRCTPIPYCEKTNAAPTNAETAQTTILATRPGPAVKVDEAAPFLGDEVPVEVLVGIWKPVAVPV